MSQLSLPDSIAQRLKARAHALNISPETLIEQWLNGEAMRTEPPAKMDDARLSHILTSAGVSLGIIKITAMDAPAYKFVYANTAFYKFHHLDLNIPCEELNPPIFDPRDDAAKMTGYLQQLVSGQEVELEYPDTLPDGNLRWVELSLIPCFEADGRVQSGVVLEYDVTRRHYTHERILSGEKRLQTIIDSLSIGLIVTDSESRVLATNTAGHEILGLTSEQFIGVRTTDSPWHAIKEDGSPFPLEERAIPTAIRTRKPALGVMMGMWRRFKDDYVWILVDAIPHLTEDGEIDFIVCSFRDISELRKAQDRLKTVNEQLENRILERTKELEITHTILQENQQRLSAILEMAGDCVISVDEEQKIIMFNRASEQVFGYTADEVIGKSLSMLIPEQLHERHRKHIDRFTRSGAKSRPMGSRSDVIGKRKDNVIFPAEASISQFSINGRRFYTAILRDRTEKVLAESNLRRSEERLRLLTDNATDMIALHNPDGRFIYASPSSVNVIGYEMDELLHRDPFDFLHPEDISGLQEIYRKVLSVDKPVNISATYRYRRKNGSYVWVETYSRPIFGSDGQIEHVVTVTRDITERRRIQEELRNERDLLTSTMETSPSGILVIDKDGNTVYANKRSEQILGVSIPEILQRPYKSPLWTHTDNYGNPLSDEDRAFQRVMRTGQPVWDVQYAIEWQGGKRVYLSVNGAPIFDEHGKISKVVFTIEDISERRNAEQTLLTSLQKEREINRMKTRFLSMASHEFKTPLSVILSASDFLQMHWRTLPQEVIRDRLVRIEEQVRALTSLLNEITHFDDTDKLRHKFEIAPVNIQEIIERIIKELQVVYPNAPLIRYEHQVDSPQLPLDAQLMTHIITNLLSNAVKYSAMTSTVVIKTQIVGHTFELTVQDQGIGIPQKDHESLFDFFHRGSNVGAITGTGVGLAIVKQAVALHGGTIDFESKVNAGTRFTIRIPLEKS